MTNTVPARDAPFRRGATALLLVDMQRIWLEPGLDPAYPERDADHDFYRHTSSVTIPNQERILKTARKHGVEVIHTIIQSLTDDGRDRSLDHKLTPIHVPRGAAEGLPVPSLAPINDEILIPKTSSGVFNSTNIDYLLKNLGIAQLVVMGIMTDQCVDMAVRDAADRGYLVVCARDACAAATQTRHETALAAFAGYCWLTDTHTVIKRIEEMTRDNKYD
ncbi:MULTISPECIES: cysteine hydrolase family protein [Rhizobium/Agrobacterium group]|uniref:cysteine hydrolase family protein n=1 Tax=Agrobacterium rosae TaxID=1972867 RepID=UPI0020339058|nr:isochorismatase family cysteine hydrolase [Agrobacterium rosae]MCM2436079.1 cysteine hydrolase [Agrobacterium rosae]